VVVLEEFEYAKRRGATVYAELAGYGMSGDGLHMTAPQESGEGRGALHGERPAQRGAQSRGTSTYVNAHGTSTPLGDLAETWRSSAAFGDHAGRSSPSARPNP